MAKPGFEPRSFRCLCKYCNRSDTEADFRNRNEQIRRKIASLQTLYSSVNDHTVDVPVHTATVSRHLHTQNKCSHTQRLTDFSFFFLFNRPIFQRLLYVRRLMDTCLTVTLLHDYCTQTCINLHKLFTLYCNFICVCQLS